MNKAELEAQIESLKEQMHDDRERLLARLTEQHRTHTTDKLALISDLLATITARDEAVADLQTQLESLRETVNELRQNNQDARTAIQEKTSALDTVSQSKAQFQAQLDAVSAEAEGLRTQLAQLEASHAQTGESLESTRLALQQSEQQAEQLREDLRRSEVGRQAGETRERIVRQDHQELLKVTDEVIEQFVELRNVSAKTSPRQKFAQYQTLLTALMPLEELVNQQRNVVNDE